MPTFETGPKRPSREDLEKKAEELWDHIRRGMDIGRRDSGEMRALERSVDTAVDMAVQDLRSTAEEPDPEKNPDSVAKQYAGYKSEDFQDLAKILEAKK